jgi:hypothetical protein
MNVTFTIIFGDERHVHHQRPSQEWPHADARRGRWFERRRQVGISFVVGVLPRF